MSSSSIKTGFFDFERVLEKLKGDGFAIEFVTNNRTRLEALTIEIVEAILDLLIAGKEREALVKFYGEGDLAALAAGAAADVAGTAAMAKRAEEFKARLTAASVWTIRALLSALAAGFLL